MQAVALSLELLKIRVSNRCLCDDRQQPNGLMAVIRRRSIDKVEFVALLGCSLGVLVTSIGKGNLVRFGSLFTGVVHSLLFIRCR
jgi:hypothetical protein